jgi:hypothetical protein
VRSCRRRGYADWRRSPAAHHIRDTACGLQDRSRQNGGNRGGDTHYRQGLGTDSDDRRNAVLAGPITGSERHGVNATISLRDTAEHDRHATTAATRCPSRPATQPRYSIPGATLPTRQRAQPGHDRRWNRAAPTDAATEFACTWASPQLSREPRAYASRELIGGGWYSWALGAQQTSRGFPTSLMNRAISSRTFKAGTRIAWASCGESTRPHQTAYRPLRRAGSRRPGSTQTSIHTWFISRFDNGSGAYVGAGAPWVQYSTTVYPNMIITHDGRVHSYAAYLYGGNWWFYYDGQWVGYIPGTSWRYPPAINLVEFGGEVATNEYATCTDKGNGLFGTQANSATVTQAGFQAPKAASATRNWPRSPRTPHVQPRPMGVRQLVLPLRRPRLVLGGRAEHPARSTALEPPRASGRAARSSARSRRGASYYTGGRVGDHRAASCRVARAALPRMPRASWPVVSSPQREARQSASRAPTCRSRMARASLPNMPRAGRRAMPHTERT